MFTLLENFEKNFYDVNITYGISLTSKQFQLKTTYDIRKLPQGNYTFTFSFLDISGTMSNYEKSMGIDYKGPQIFKQFSVANSTIDKYINPLNGSLYFKINDFSGIDSYWFNQSFEGYWITQEDLYTFYFNDNSIPEGITYVNLYANDTLGYTSSKTMKLYFDGIAPVFGEVINHNETFNGLYAITVEVMDISGYYDLSLEITRSLTQEQYSNVQYSLHQIELDRWMFLLDTSQFEPGFYDVKVIATDGAGNSKCVSKFNRYFDYLPPIVNSTLFETIENEKSVKYSLDDIGAFNNKVNLSVVATDQEFDNFSWNDIDHQLGLQKGVYSVNLRFTHILKWQQLHLTEQLDINKFVYEIEGFGIPLDTDLTLIKQINAIKIDGVTIKFNLFKQGESLYLEIDEGYRYLLIPENSERIQVEFYEACEIKVPLSYNIATYEWELENFNIADYIPIQEGNSFLYWFEIYDGLGYATYYDRPSNVINTKKHKVIYDISLEKVSGSLFEWNLGKDSQNRGILIFGTEDYDPSTIVINSSKIILNNYSKSDILKIEIYGSSTQGIWVKIGKATQEFDKYYYYWNEELLDEIPNYNYLKVVVYDKAFNKISETQEITIYDYSEISLITNLIIEDIIEYDQNVPENFKSIYGEIVNFFGETQLWDVVNDYYNNMQEDWIPLNTNPATLSVQFLKTEYKVTWDIDQDPEFTNNLDTFTSEYLPLQVRPETDKNIYGTWAKFGNNYSQPIILSQVANLLHIGIFNFSYEFGWTINSQISGLTSITCSENDIFKVKDVNKDGFAEILRLTPSQVDLIFYNSSLSQWVLMENITNSELQSYITFDIKQRYNGEVYISLAHNNASFNTLLSLYKFNGFELTKRAEVVLPENLLPSAISIEDDIESVLISGTINGSYFSEVYSYNFDLEDCQKIYDKILGKPIVITYKYFDGVDSIFLGVRRTEVGQKDAVILLEFNSELNQWIPLELNLFDSHSFEIIDLMAIQDTIANKLITASTEGVYETKIKHEQNNYVNFNSLLYAAEIYRKDDLLSASPRLYLKNIPINTIENVYYQLNGEEQWSELGEDKYEFSRWEILLDLGGIYNNLEKIKIVYSYRTGSVSDTKLYDTSYQKYSSQNTIYNISASSKQYNSQKLPLLYDMGTSNVELPYYGAYQNIPIITDYRNNKLYQAKALKAVLPIYEGYKVNLSTLENLGEIINIRGFREEWDGANHSYPVKSYQLGENILSLDRIYSYYFTNIEISYLPRIDLEFRNDKWYVPSFRMLNSINYSYPLFISKVWDENTTYGTYFHEDLEIGYTLVNDNGDLWVNFTHPSRINGTPSGVVLYGKKGASDSLTIPSMKGYLNFDYELLDTDFENDISGEFEVSLNFGIETSKYAECQILPESFKIEIELLSKTPDGLISIGSISKFLQSNELGTSTKTIMFSLENITYSSNESIAKSILKESLTRYREESLCLEVHSLLDAHINGFVFEGKLAQEILTASFKPEIPSQELLFNGDQVNTPYIPIVQKDIPLTREVDSNSYYFNESLLDYPQAKFNIEKIKSENGILDKSSYKYDATSKYLNLIGLNESYEGFLYATITFKAFEWDLNSISTLEPFNFNFANEFITNTTQFLELPIKFGSIPGYE
ncbi:MAG: hypothetical protein P8Y97_08085, partial [Candidatus Lokiarchaeota archaeon]